MVIGPYMCVCVPDGDGGPTCVCVYLTVMGMEARRSLSLSCSLAPLLITT